MQEKNWQNMSTSIGNTLNSNDCLAEFSKEFSEIYIPKFREVFYFFKENAVDENSLIRKLHLGYTAMRPEAFDFVANVFPWLEDFRVKFGLEKKLNFLETNGLEKPEFKLHIDGQIGDPSVMFNCPVLNCTNETVTYWIEPQEEYDTILLCENGTKTEKKYGATPHISENTKYRIVHTYSITDRCVLFRSDVFHGVKNKSNRNEDRIMMHWWFPKTVNWSSDNIETILKKGQLNGI